MNWYRLLFGALLLLCVSAHASQENAGKELTILYTNDIESVYEPVEAHWRDDMDRIGGMPRLSSLVRQLRTQYPSSILVDAGDMFTGSLSKATEGKLVFDLYSQIGYDAGNLGNHEFEYGWRILEKVMQRARFPMLNANIFFEATGTNLTRQYAILDVGGIRVGVIGLMGVDAFLNTMMISNREGLTVKAPAEVAQPIIDMLRPEVDMVILLTHQNRTAPMQTDKEADPEVARGFDEDYALAGTVQGVDMIIGGHSDHGLQEPVIHPATGTAIGMTYGQGMHLGFARFEFDESGRARLLEGRLIPVNADVLPEDPAVVKLIEAARAAHPELTRMVGYLETQATRRYYRESTLGNLMADMLRDHTGADVGLMPAGAIRADLAAGDVTVEDILNVFPFTDRVSVLELDGSVLKQVFEKSLSLEYGLVQFSGVELSYDLDRPQGQRLVTATVNGRPLVEDQEYTLVTGSFTATGGENYTMFNGLPLTIQDTLVSDVLINMFHKRGAVKIPPLGRQLDITGK